MDIRKEWVVIWLILMKFTKDLAIHSHFDFIGVYHCSIRLFLNSWLNQINDAPKSLLADQAVAKKQAESRFPLRGKPAVELSTRQNIYISQQIALWLVIWIWEVRMSYLEFECSDHSQSSHIKSIFHLSCQISINRQIIEYKIYCVVQQSTAWSSNLLLGP